jgi:hypothetical protein
MTALGDDLAAPAAQNLPLAGVLYTLYNCRGCVKGSQATGADGIAAVTASLKPGCSYTLEKSVPSGYYNDGAARKVTVGADCTVLIDGQTAQTDVIEKTVKAVSMTGASYASGAISAPAGSAAPGAIVTVSNGTLSSNATAGSDGSWTMGFAASLGEFLDVKQKTKGGQVSPTAVWEVI